MEQFVLPKSIATAFPILNGAGYVRSFASLVPFAPDTVFHIFINGEGLLFALVATDYIDLTRQKDELLKVSGQYQLRFDGVVALNGNVISEAMTDDKPENAFVEDGNTRYYLTKLTGQF